MSQKVDANLPAPAELDAELATLDAAVQAKDHGAPLDQAYASLDRVEDYLAAALDAAQGEARALLVRRAEWYVGSTLVHNAHGVWAIREDSAGSPRPHVIRLPELGKYAFLPGIVVNTFTRTRGTRVLRDGTEVYDIPHRREVTSALLAAEARELAAFADDVQELTGKAEKLDPSIEKLDLVQAALTRLVVENAPRDRARQVYARAVLHVGAVFKAEIPSVTWELCTEPENRAVGQLTLDGFAPVILLRKIAPRTGPGLLKQMVTNEVDARR